MNNIMRDWQSAAFDSKTHPLTVIHNIAEPDFPAVAKAVLTMDTTIFGSYHWQMTLEIAGIIVLTLHKNVTQEGSKEPPAEMVDTVKHAYNTLVLWAKAGLHA